MNTGNVLLLPMLSLWDKLSHINEIRGIHVVCNAFKPSITFKRDNIIVFFKYVDHC